MAASDRAEGSHAGDDGRVPTALLSFQLDMTASPAAAFAFDPALVGTPGTLAGSGCRNATGCERLVGA
jgi:hypothetical protein